MARARPLLAVLVAAALTGCVAGTEGMQGVYVFYDRTPPSQHDFPWDGDQLLDAPLATGATMTVGVTYRGFAVRPERVQTDPPGVVTVDALTDGGFVVTGKAEGEVLLTVTGPTRWDQVRLSVRQPSVRRVEPRPWDWYPLPASYHADGLAVLQGATSHLFGRALAGTEGLTGHGSAAFRAAGDQSKVAGTPREGSDFLDLAGVAPGTERFAWGDSGEVEVACVVAGDIVDVRPLEAWHVQAGSDYLCQVGETLLVALLPYDGEGRLVTGTTQDIPAPTVAIAAGSEALVSDTTPSDPGSGLKEVLQNRTVFLRCDAVGRAEATVSWNGFERAVTVDVRPKSR